MTFARRIAADAVLIGAHLDWVLAEKGDEPVIAAMRYAAAGGKRLRGFLVLEGARLHGMTAPQALPAAAAETIPVQAVVELQRARVEIYCGHNSQAVAGIRAASRQLRASPAAVPAQTFATLDEAAWLTRHDQYVRAEQALDKALLQIAIAGAAA